MAAPRTIVATDALLHTWSLGVEEPIAIGGSLGISIDETRSHGRRPSRLVLQKPFAFNAHHARFRRTGRLWFLYPGLTHRRSQLSISARCYHHVHIAYANVAALALRRPNRQALQYRIPSQRIYARTQNFCRRQRITRVTC